MTRDYPRLPLEEFGQELLLKQDLDPVYTALHGAQLELDHLRRWLLAYWCLYNAGIASWLSDRRGQEFFHFLLVAAYNDSPSPIGDRWPRGRERRHWRGQKAIDSAQFFLTQYNCPEDAVRQLERPGPYSEVRKRVMTWPQFGPWIAFKVGDMLERLMGVAVDFSATDIFFFDSPRVAAEEWLGAKEKNGETAAWHASAWLSHTLGHYPAPPSNNRLLNLQEYETILCKWHSHNTGHYPVGIDTHELREALEPWTVYSPTAIRLLSHV